MNCAQPVKGDCIFAGIWIQAKVGFLCKYHAVHSHCLQLFQLRLSDKSFTVLCKSNANDNRRISRFFLTIYRQYISETSHGLLNVKTINHRDIGTIFAISRQDIVLARLRCNDISQSKRYITTIYHSSEVRSNDMS